ncbi:MAG: peptidoglycan DD-metalloendopeptidase family protein [Thermaceae bacterium]|nr:peptidoglycan DD-metalloendopeptidase family protein [Thermaceae bacterium]
MRPRRHPVRYTLWLARTGAAPRTLSLPVWVPLVVFLGLAGWSGLNLWLWNRTAEMRGLQIRLVSLSEQARTLGNQLESERTRNNSLSEKAQTILHNLQTLEDEINRLRARAGMPQIRLTPTRNDSAPKGGAAAPASLEEVLRFAGSEAKRLNGNLGDVSPALTETLQREAALPFGYPLEGYLRTASTFGYRRNPFGWGFEFHNGLDFPAPYGTPIHVTGSGEVVSAGWNGPFGQAVIVDHGYGYKTLYGHMSQILVKVGDHVERGDVLGLVGSTGRSTGPHVHYTVFQGDMPVNPDTFLN